MSGAGSVTVVDLLLQNETLTDSRTYEASNSITATNFRIDSTADVTLRAGAKIVLRTGFSVISGARFVAEIDPSIGVVTLVPGRR